MLYRQLDLYISGTESYTLAPHGQDGQSLTIHRDTGTVTLNASGTTLPPRYEMSRYAVYGVVGLLSLSFSDYLILIVGRQHRGQLLEHDIYHATSFEILPISRNTAALQHPVERHLYSLVSSHFANGLFWFSYDYDMTRTVQSQWASVQQDTGKSLWETAEDNFFWNKFLQSRLIETTKVDSAQNLSPFILPIIYGTFEIRPVSINGRVMQMALVSRRSRYRAGTRYFRRGVDQEGHVANFNETEQIVFVAKSGAVSINDPSGELPTTLAFVQIRGSIPLFWAEVNTLQYKPDLQVMEMDGSAEAMRKHFQDLEEKYGNATIVSMVNQKGYEQPIKQAYEKYVNEIDLPYVRYEYFDFHHECRHMQWHKINGMIERIEDELNKYGYFYLEPSASEPRRQQTGVVRTNCMDNLDRTNVGQAAIAKWTLNKQLREVGVLQPTETVDEHEAFMDNFRNMWADHADLISTAYSGTGALKTDFTRTGKRTKVKGPLQDGYNSVMRYLKNNFLDGARQDAFDVVTGAWVPSQGTAVVRLLHDERPLVIRSMPYVFFFSLFMTVAGLTLPRTSNYSLSYYFIFWLTILLLSLAFIFAHGIDYVAWPRLNPLNDVIHYEGPGFRSKPKGRGLKFPAALLSKSPALAKASDWTMQGRKRRPGSVKLNEVEMGMKQRLD